MFEASSKYYDLVYSFKDYKKEAEQIRLYIEKKGQDCRTILDVASGTAQHAFYLKDHFSVDGIDLNPEFISIARSKNPEGNFYVADMTDFQLNTTYDVIMCLFSAIGYVQTLENVAKTLSRFKEHLNENGLILVEPWFTPDVWSDGRVDTLTAELDGIKMCRMSHSQRQDRVSIQRFDYLVGSGMGIEHFSEEHRMGLFTVGEMIQTFKDVGLEVEYDEQGISGRGIYVARKRR